jgi:CheY-like chemotaxis protein/HPt (histidine-containing phosphotransfer) domain-containing protein
MHDKDERTFSGVSLLLAEDEPLNADIASRTLAKLGCRVAVASDGLAAVRMWEECAFDLVLMDCEMPGMDGLEAARQIRRLEAKASGRRVPIVALSAHAPEEIRERCLAAGMDDALAKPFKETLLKTVLAALLDKERGPVLNPVETQLAAQKPSGGIDRHVLESISAFQGANGRVLLKSMVTRFASMASDQLARIRKNHGNGEMEEVRRIAHTLKSSSAAMGATGVSRCCGEIEMRAGRGEGALLSAFLSTLEDELASAIRDLGEIAGEHKEPNRVAG